MSFEELNEEARLLHEQIVPMFDDHSCGAILLVIAHLFAYWLSLHDREDLTRNALMLNKAAIEIYETLLRDADREKLH